MSTVKLNRLFQELKSWQVNINDYKPETNSFELAFELISIEVALAGIIDKVLSGKNISAIDKEALSFELQFGRDKVVINQIEYPVNSSDELYRFSLLLFEIKNELLNS